MSDKWDDGSVKLDGEVVVDPDGNKYYMPARSGAICRWDDDSQVTAGLGRRGPTLTADAPEEARRVIRNAWREMAYWALVEGRPDRERGAVARRMEAPDAKVKEMLDEVWPP